MLRLRRLACVLLPLCLGVPPLILFLSSPLAPPSAFSSLPPSFSASSSSCSSPSVCLRRSAFCSVGCYASCFPRIRGICFYPSQVRICQDIVHRRQGTALNTSETESCSRLADRASDVPSIMRFYGERLTLPVAHSSFCGSQQKRLIRGLAMTADQRYLPFGKPNPHHEAEKLLPALLMSQKLKGLANVTLYWFASQQELSAWAVGFMQALGVDRIVRFLELPKTDQAAVCFEDAVVFSAPTNLRYIPDRSWNQWLRRKVFHQCSISSGDASWPMKSAAILDREGGRRHLLNKQQVAESINRVLNISVRQGFGGVGNFCEQVQAVAASDLLIVPHGSQNTNLLFARPRTTVIEVFPYLYYTDALRNLTHAADLQLYAMLGKRSKKNFLMWLFSLAGWDVCFAFKWCKNYARRQPITVDTQELDKILAHVSYVYLQPLPSSN